MSQCIVRGAVMAASIGLAALSVTPPAQATVIDINIATPGSRSLSFGRFAAGPTVFEGGGDFNTVLAAAADVWEALLGDNRHFSITVGWSTGLPVGVLAAAAPRSDTSNEIVFNANQAFFADPTPGTNEEVSGFVETSADFGGGLINSSRGYASALFAGTDLLSVALHEIGHALGNATVSTRSPPLFGIFDGPFAGTVLPCAERNAGATCAHLAIAGALMSTSAGLSNGEFKRTLIGGADLLFIATDGGFVNFDTDLVRPSQVPEPGGLTLLLYALTAFSAIGSRRARGPTIAG